MESADQKIDGEVKESPQVISERDQLFRRAFSYAAIGLALVELDGRFIYTNPAYSKITGYSAEELKHLTIAKLMHPEDAKANLVFRQKMLAGKIPGYVLEKRYIKKDGSHVWVKSSISLGVDDQGQPAYIIGLTEDIDERRKAEEALRESEARFRFMAEYMPPKIFTAEPDGTIDYLSPQWMEYTGIAFKDMDFRGWKHVLHPDDREDNFRLWAQAVSTGEPFYFEHRLLRADGVYRWHVIRAHAMRDKEDTIIKWIGSDTDIEELHQNRGLRTRLEMLAKQRQQLISLNRSKDEFIMLASHQLRTPATGVKQYLGLFIEGYIGKVSKQQLELLKRAYACNERQLRIADDLLRVAQVDAGQLQLTKTATDLVALITEVIGELQDTFTYRRQKVNFSTSLPQVLASVDMKLIYMVLENLLDNASKYSPQGRTIGVHLRHTWASAVIDIEDHGVGILKKDQAKLFKKFSRINNPLSAEVGGTGLGLYWVKKVVTMHDGTLTVQSKVQTGSTFTVKLPLA